MLRAGAHKIIGHFNKIHITFLQVQLCTNYQYCMCTLVHIHVGLIIYLTHDLKKHHFHQIFIDDN